MQACGAKHHILEEEVDETDVDDVVVALVNKAKRVSFTFIMSSFCGALSIFFCVCICISYCFSCLPQTSTISFL